MGPNLPRRLWPDATVSSHSCRRGTIRLIRPMIIRRQAIRHLWMLTLTPRIRDWTKVDGDAPDPRPPAVPFPEFLSGRGDTYIDLTPDDRPGREPNSKRRRQQEPIPDPKVNLDDPYRPYVQGERSGQRHPAAASS